VVLASLLLFAALAAPEPPASEPLPKGEVVPKVVCASDPEETYAAYLPPSYDADKPAPILYLLDARRRGVLALERFRESSEKYGWILASSNNSESDGPITPNIGAMRAMWDDTHSRFSIDPRRVYATGFSGCARVVCVLAQSAAKQQIAGVIGVGAGFNEKVPPYKDLPFVFFGLVGNSDFNYREMRQLDKTLASLGNAHRLVVFEGSHTWPPAADCTRAIEWMELSAMRSGRRSRDERLLAEWLARASQEAAALEAAGRKGEALVRYREIAEDFDGLADVSSVRASLERLEKDREARREIERQEHLEKEEDAELAEARQKLASDMRADEPQAPERIAQDLRLAALRRRAESGSSEAERSSARRILNALYVQNSFYLPREYLTHQDSRRAALSASIAAEVYPDRAGSVWYNFACLQAGAGDKKSALATLRRAVEKGFRDAERMETDPDLESLRGEAEYRQIVEGLKKAGAPSS